MYRLTASVAGTIREPETAYDGEASIELGIVHFPEQVVAETLKKVIVKKVSNLSWLRIIRLHVVNTNKMPNKYYLTLLVE